MRNRVCALQFTGGRDSTLAAIKLAESALYDEIYLLTFKTDLMSELDKVKVNINRLNLNFKNKVKFHHRIVDTQDLLVELYHDKYFESIKQFGFFHVATFCPSCRLSHHIHTLIFCLQNDVGIVADGVNELTGFDLFQQGWGVEKIRKLYKRFGIEYITLLLNAKVSSEIVLKQYNESNAVPEPFSESQPKCLGGGQFHNLFLRCYYLPIKGKEAYVKISTQWIDYAMAKAVQHIYNHLEL